MNIIFREEAPSPLAGFNVGSSILAESEFGDAGFRGGGKLGTGRKTLLSKMRTNNKLYPNMAPAGVEPRLHCWEVSALSTGHLISLKSSNKLACHSSLLRSVICSFLENV